MLYDSNIGRNAIVAFLSFLLAVSYSSEGFATEPKEGPGSISQNKEKKEGSVRKNEKHGGTRRKHVRPSRHDLFKNTGVANSAGSVSDPDDDEEEEGVVAGSEGSKKEEEKDPIVVNLEFATDFVFRGNTFGSESISQRDNLPYRSLLPAYTFQPSIEIPITEKLSLEFWFNLFLTHKGDTDSDQRYLQSQPGGPELLGYYQPDLQRGRLPFDPHAVHPYKEDNGLKWDDGGEIQLEYELANLPMGVFSVGFFSYNAFLPENRFSWTQVFVVWEIPIFKFLNPKLSFFKTTDPDTDAHTTGINKGWGYIPLEMGHEFDLGKSWKFFAGTSVGYIIKNNPVDNRSGISDITSTLKLSYGKFFVSANMAYRPNLEIYDSGYYFDNKIDSQEPQDGKTADPSKQYGFQNSIVENYVRELTANPMEQKLILDSYQAQGIRNAIYYFSIGYTTQI